ncbi:hypothetical protein BC826DRAFT_1048712 [Russula brevipes]|nr:hypothetical protein BC826DRAFT_1048712 [Russula brevipes]
MSHDMVDFCFFLVSTPAALCSTHRPLGFASPAPPRKCCPPDSMRMGWRGRYPLYGKVRSQFYHHRHDSPLRCFTRRTLDL